MNLNIRDPFTRSPVSMWTYVLHVLCMDPPPVHASCPPAVHSSILHAPYACIASSIHAFISSILQVSCDMWHICMHTHVKCRGSAIHILRHQLWWWWWWRENVDGICVTRMSPVWWRHHTESNIAVGTTRTFCKTSEQGRGFNHYHKAAALLWGFAKSSCGPHSDVIFIPSESCD